MFYCSYFDYLFSFLRRHNFNDDILSENVMKQQRSQYSTYLMFDIPTKMVVFLLVQCTARLSQVL